MGPPPRNPTTTATTRGRGLPHDAQQRPSVEDIGDAFLRGVLVERLQQVLQDLGVVGLQAEPGRLVLEHPTHTPAELSFPERFKQHLHK